MNKLLQSERLVIESFLKQADAVLTMVGNIDANGAHRVMRAAIRRETRGSDRSLTESLVDATKDFYQATKLLAQATKKTREALDVDADRKDEEANRRSQDASLDEMVERWEAELQAEKEAEFMAKLVAYCKSTSKSLSTDAADIPFHVTHLGQIRGTDRWQVPSVFKWL